MQVWKVNKSLSSNQIKYNLVKSFIWLKKTPQFQF